MRIDYDRFSEIKSAANALFWDKHISIGEVASTKTPDGRRVTLGVNWAAMGTKTTEDTMDYAQNLLRAAAVVKLINDCDLAYYYSEEVIPCNWEQFNAKVTDALMRLSRQDLLKAFDN